MLLHPWMLAGEAIASDASGPHDTTPPWDRVYMEASTSGTRDEPASPLTPPPRTPPTPARLSRTASGGSFSKPRRLSRQLSRGTEGFARQEREGGADDVAQDQPEHGAHAPSASPLRSPGEKWALALRGTMRSMRLRSSSMQAQRSLLRQQSGSVLQSGGVGTAWHNVGENGVPLL